MVFQNQIEHQLSAELGGDMHDLAIARKEMIICHRCQKKREWFLIREWGGEME